MFDFKKQMNLIELNAEIRYIELFPNSHGGLQRMSTILKENIAHVIFSS